MFAIFHFKLYKYVFSKVQGFIQNEWVSDASLLGWITKSTFKDVLGSPPYRNVIHAAYTINHEIKRRCQHKSANSFSLAARLVTNTRH